MIVASSLLEVFKDGVIVRDQDKTILGWGLPRSALLKRGIEKSQLERLVKHGHLKKIHCTESKKGPNGSVSSHSIVAVYVLEHPSAQEEADRRSNAKAKKTQQA